MWFLLGFVGATVFLAGLYQWAQSGATLWKIFAIKRKESSLSRDEIRAAEKEVQKLEKAADRTITASFKIIAALAVIVWLFFGVTMLLDMFGINWISTLSSKAKVYWTNTNVTSVTTDSHSKSSKAPAPNRNERLKSMSSGLKK